MSGEMIVGDSEGKKEDITNLEAEIPETCKNSQERQNEDEASDFTRLMTSSQIPNNPPNVLTRQLTVQGRLIISSLALLGLCFPMVFYTLLKTHTYWVPIETPSETTLVLWQEQSSAQLSRQLIVEVTSSRDLENLEGAESVVISNLEISSPLLQYLSAERRLEYPTVKNLTVSGRVSVEWLEYIIGSFVNLQHLSVDMTAICFSDTMESPLTYPPLVLKTCETFEVINSNTCYLEDWIYRWQFPHVTKIIFRNVHINRRNCKKVNRLLNDNGGSHMHVKFHDCNIYDCILEAHGKSGRYNLTIDKANIPTAFRAK